MVVDNDDDVDVKFTNFLQEAIENDNAQPFCAELVKIGAFDNLQRFLELETDKVWIFFNYFIIHSLIYSRNIDSR